MARPTSITVEELFDSPVRAGASISPDGTRLAYLAPWKDRLNIWVQGVDSDAEPRCVTADDNRSVYIYQWTDDSWWLLYLQDGDGDENWHVYRVHPDAPDAAAVDLTPFPGAKAFFELAAGRPGKAIVQLNTRRPDQMDVYELDIATGELSLLAEVIQGANDSRVVQAESDNLVEALRARGVEVEYMVKADEGHGFVNPDNLIDMYRVVERVLAEH
jgi:dipeptidyl aminopeptidase/acylaminoacyl peptidase